MRLFISVSDPGKLTADAVYSVDGNLDICREDS